VDDRIKEHLKQLNKYYLLLSDMCKTDFEKYENDPILQGSSERFLQLAIESCLNIGNRLISIHQFDNPIDTPETYADIFLQMKNLGVIDEAFCERLIKMAKFRNRLVHLYWEIERQMVYRIIQENLDDFKLFQEKVVAFLKQTGTSDQMEDQNSR